MGKFLTSNVTAFIQPMNQGVISALKRNYWFTFLQRQIEEGNNLKSFWNDFTTLYAIYEINSARESTKPLTIIWSWKKIIPDIGVDPLLGRNFLDLKKKIRDSWGYKKCTRGEDVDNDDIREWLHFGIGEQGLKNWHMIK